MRVTTDDGKFTQQAQLVIFLGLAFVVGAVFGEMVGPVIPIGVGLGIVLAGIGALSVGYYRRPK